MDINNQFFRAVTACCFLVLAAVQSVYALKVFYSSFGFELYSAKLTDRLSLQLHTVSQIRYARYLSCSQETMFYVNCVLVASFASRSLYQILATFDVSTLPDVPLSVSRDHLGVC